MQIDEKALQVAYDTTNTVDGLPYGGGHVSLTKDKFRSIVEAYEAAKSAHQPDGLTVAIDIINGLHAEIDEIIRVAKTNPYDIQGFLKVNYRKQWRITKGNEVMLPMRESSDVNIITHDFLPSYAAASVNGMETDEECIRWAFKRLLRKYRITQIEGEK